ncbi:MAG: hypothetical protein E7351_01980 [Clostridiales bacterium]|nr:hypothetical protein [Clostridiales bacterium]
MLRRDFTKTNKDYFNKNKVVLMAVAMFLLLGVLIASIFGFNGNFEMKGCYQFTVTVEANKSDKYSDYADEISKIVNSYGGDYDTTSIAGEGDSTQLVVRYMVDLSGENEVKINLAVAEKLDVASDKISSHSYVSPVVKGTDYVYTAAAILLIVLIASIFAFVRYNGASAMAIILGCTLGSLGFMAITAILRLSVGLSYFAILTILNMLIIYFAIELFESMHKSSWLANEDYAQAMDTAIKASKFRMLVMSVAIMLVGVLFIILAPATLKYVSLSIMFMAVVVLAVGWYVMPFVWNVFITRCKKREYKVKASNIEDKEEKE